jgi:hypothetical protein|nr:MAG TPA: hypothetical protein [Caudoviricetes sp.]
MYRQVKIRKRRKRLILVCPNSERNMNYVQRLDELHLLEKYTVYPEKIELITVTLDVPVDKYVFKKFIRSWGIYGLKFVDEMTPRL